MELNAASPDVIAAARAAMDDEDYIALSASSRRIVATLSVNADTENDVFCLYVDDAHRDREVYRIVGADPADPWSPATTYHRQIDDGLLTPR